MFQVNDDLSIYATRGDVVFFAVSADNDGKPYQFTAGDVVRMKVYGKKNAENLLMQKDFPVIENTESVDIYLTESDTKIGGIISKPTDYWYEIELNPFTAPQTIIGYDENGAKVFKLFPEGADISETPVDPETVKVMDEELDLTSNRPVENRAIARAVAQLDSAIKVTSAKLTASTNALSGDVASLESEIGVERARINNLVATAVAPVSGDDAAYTEVVDVRVGADGKTYASAGDAVRKQFAAARKEYAYGYVFLNQEPTFTYVNNSYLELTLHGNTEVFYNGKYHTITDASARYDFSNNAALFVILFNYATKTISIQHFASQMPDNCVLIGTTYQDVLNLNLYGINKNNIAHIDSYSPASVSVFCDVVPSMTYTDQTVNGVYSGHIKLVLPRCYVNTGYSKFDILGRTVECDTTTAGIFNILYNKKKDEILIEHRLFNVRHGYYQIGIIHTSSGVYMNGGYYITKPYNLSVAPLILGWSNTFVEFDSVNKTVTFPDDTLIQFNRSLTGRRHYQLSNASGNTSASWEHLTTTALMVVFDTLNQTLSVIPYNSMVWDWQIIIATFRTACGQVAINAPYKWDGKAFNMDAADLGINADDLGGVNFNVKSVNHRGYCTEAPENTLAAYRLSAKKKFEYVECDISFTSDGVPVLLHDNTIDRTSNGTGNISNMTLAEARAFDYGSWFSSKFAGEQIPTAEEFIALCRKLGLHPYIEIKSGTEDQIKSLVYIVKRYGMLKNVTWISFTANLLRYVKAADASARLGFVVNTITADAVNTAIGLRNDSNEVFIDAGSSDNIALCVDANIPVERWTVNGNAAVIALDPYVSGVTSDNVHAGRVLYDSAM